MVQLGLDDGTHTEIVKGDVYPGDELIIGESAGIPGGLKPNAAARSQTCDPDTDSLLP